MPEPLIPPPADEQVVSTSAASPPASASSRWEDFIDIFYAPTAVYERRQNAGFGIPMLVVTLLSAGITLAAFNAMSPAMDADFTRNAASQMAKGGMTAEQMAAARSIGEKIAKVMIVILPPIVMLIAGITLWVCGKLVGARQTVTAAIMVMAYAWVPRVLGGIASAAQALLMDPAQMHGMHSLTLSAARFMDADTVPPVLLALGMRVELFTIWATVLLAIGLAVTGKIPRSKAAIAAALVWVLGSLPTVLPALRQ